VASSDEEVIVEKPSMKQAKKQKAIDESDEEDIIYTKPEKLKPKVKAHKKTEEENKEAEEIIKMKTIAQSEGDIFSGLIKKASTTSQAKELTLSSEDLSSINKKVYSCISELQLEYMR
jgi:hypothetical protein